MITIIDYGLGNVKAFQNIYEKLNVPICVARNTDNMKNATKLILPGVGAFDYAMKRLNVSGMREKLEKMVLEHSVPIIGICVGMQILAKCSEEGLASGLGWIDATVKRFNFSDLKSKFQLPHMGWNTIDPSNNNLLMKNLTSKSRFYFLHSYYFQCNTTDDTIATTNYGIQFTSAINRKNIYGVQFHPEKSHQSGIQLLKNFKDL